MRKHLLILFLSLCFIPSPAQNTFKERLSKIPNLRIVPKENIHFKEYYEITFSQELDHTHPGEKFDQRIFIGFQDIKASVVLETDGYSLYSSNNLKNELSDELHANLILLEHRFCGQSTPDSINWNLMTLRQAAADAHFVKTMLDTIFTGKWISTGISKGGQAALAYKLYYPADVYATVVYGTAVKNKQTVLTDTLLSELSKTDCGKKINALQSFIFKHKAEYLANFKTFMEQQKVSFSPMQPDVVFEYMLLELPYSYWQNGNKCEEIPDSTKSVVATVNYLMKIVSPLYYTTQTKQRIEPAFYMFYHELGYYEYTIKPFKKQLSLMNDTYSNKIFMPTLGASSLKLFKFDDSFQKGIAAFIQTPAAQNVFFIYGENDPWFKQTIAKTNVFVVPAGSHKSRIKDLDETQKNILSGKIKVAIN